MSSQRIKLLELKLERERMRNRLGLTSPTSSQKNVTPSLEERKRSTILRSVRKSVAKLTGLHGFITPKSTMSTPSPSKFSSPSTFVTPSPSSISTPPRRTSRQHRREELLATKAKVISLERKLEKERRKSVKRNSSFMETHEGIVHGTKIRLNAEIASTQARNRIETLRLHGRILKLRREKEDLKEENSNILNKHEVLVKRLIEVELKCRELLVRLKCEKSRSKQMMMDNALSLEKKHVTATTTCIPTTTTTTMKSDDAVLSSDTKYFLIFTLLSILCVFLVMYFDLSILRRTYTFLIDLDFVTTRERVYNASLASEYLDDIFLKIKQSSSNSPLQIVGNSMISASSPHFSYPSTILLLLLLLSIYNN